MKTDHIIALISDLREKAHEFIIQEFNARGINGLVPSHGSILNALFQYKSMSMQELANQIGRSKSTVTTLVKKLVNAGYIARTKDPHDNRVTHIHLTELGKQLKPDFNDISRELLERTYQALSDREKEAVVDGLEKILEHW